MILRNGTFYLKLAVPKKLWATYGKRQVWRSLKTTNPVVAQARAVVEAAKYRAHFEKLIAAQDAAPVTLPSPRDFATAYLQRALKDDMAYRVDQELRGLTDPTDESEWHVHTTRLEELDGDPAREGMALLDHVSRTAGVDVPKEQRAAFAYELLQAEKKLLLEMLDRASKPVDVSAVTQDDGQTKLTLGELAEDYLKNRHLPAKSIRETHYMVGRFAEQAGGLQRKVSTITKADVRKYRANVLASGRSPSTQKKLLGCLSTIFRYGVTAGLIETNPWDGLITVSGVHPANSPTRRLPYSPEQARVLMEASSKLTGAKRWIVWLGFYTGMRAEEICGLRAQDLKQERGVWFFDVCVTVDRRLKTRGSARRIPVHPKLMEAGLLDHLQRVPKDGMLFPDLSKAGGKYSKTFGQWYSKWADGLGHGLDSPRLCLHSARHSFKSACRDAAVPEEIHDQLTGHVTASVGRSYGLGASLSVLAEWVAKLSYEDTPVG